MESNLKDKEISELKLPLELCTIDSCSEADGAGSGLCLSTIKSSDNASYYQVDKFSTAAGDIDNMAMALETEILDKLKEIKLRIGQAIVLTDESESVGTYESNETSRVPKFAYNLDFESWLKQKNQMKQNETDGTYDDDMTTETSDPENNEQIREMAWVNWILKKEKDLLEKKMALEKSKQTEESLIREKKLKAQRKFEEWYRKKEELTSKKKEVVPTNSNEAEQQKKGQPKLTRHIDFKEWKEKKKSQVVPKSYTHDNYPKPSWVNPIPWQGLDLPVSPKVKKE